MHTYFNEEYTLFMTTSQKRAAARNRQRRDEWREKYTNTNTCTNTSVVHGKVD